jgi:hypothetical protein
MFLEIEKEVGVERRHPPPGIILMNIFIIYAELYKQYWAGI